MRDIISSATGFNRQIHSQLSNCKSSSKGHIRSYMDIMETRGSDCVFHYWA